MKRGQLIVILIVVAFFAGYYLLNEQLDVRFSPLFSAIAGKQQASTILEKSYNVKTTEDKMMVEYFFPVPKITKGDGDYNEVNIPGFLSIGHVGEPVMPAEGFNVLIPAGKQMKSYSIKPGRKISLSGRCVPGPQGAPVPLCLEDEENFVQTEPKSDVYFTGNIYPLEKGAHVGENYFRGYRIETFNLFPVEFDPEQEKCSYYESLVLEIELEPESAESNVLSVRQEANDKRLVEQKVINPELASTYETVEVGGASRSSVLDPQEIKYVLITNEELASANVESPDIPGSVSGEYSFQDLIDSKTAKGLSATIVTTEWIYANYGGTRPDGGEDDATRIRNFIIDAYENWETEYVLLGGDGDGADVGGESGDNIIPVRGLAFYGGVTDLNIPADLYYGCLDGTFDGNSNGFYGEWHEEPDLRAEVFVGRAPVDSAYEVSNFVRKTLNYELTEITTPYLTEAYLVGEHLGFGGVSEYAYGSMEEIREGSDWGEDDGGTAVGFDDSGFYNTHGLYDYEEAWGANQLISIMNGGVHIFNHLGHANNGINMKLHIDDVDEQLTNDEYFLINTQGCYPGAFDNRNPSGAYLNYDSIGEHFVTEEHGAFAFIGNSRYGWGEFDSTHGASQWFQRQFWDALFDEWIFKLGEINQDAKEDNIAWVDYSVNRWCYYEINLLGDPEISLKWELPPGRTKITSPRHGVEVEGGLDVYGFASGEGFQSYILEYGVGVNPTEYIQFAYSNVSVDDGLLGTLSTTGVPDGVFTLRLTTTYGEDTASHYRKVIANNLELYTKGVVTGTIDILGKVPEGYFYKIEYGGGTDPSTWTLIAEVYDEPVGDLLYEGFDTRALIEGEHSLKITAFTASDPDFSNDVSVIDVDNVHILSPQSGSLRIEGETLIPIEGAAVNADFSNYVIELGEGLEPDVYSSEGVILENGGQEEVVDGLLGTIDTSLIGSGYFRVRLRVYDTAGLVGEEFTDFYVDNEQLPGWPVQLEDLHMVGSPRAEDLDGDGTKEVIIVSKDELYVINFDGSIRDGWPISVRDPAEEELSTMDSVGATPAIADLDFDGTKEIIFPRGSDSLYGAEMFVLRHDGSMFPGWPRQIDSYQSDQARAWFEAISPSVGDIDNDGDLEIVFMDSAANSEENEEPYMGKAYVWHHDGTTFDGWPIGLFYVPYCLGPHTHVCDLIHVGSVGLADVTGDGYLELVFKYVNDDGTLLETKTSVMNKEGDILPGWPHITESPSAFGLFEPAIGDIDGDGDFEIVVIDSYGAAECYVTILNGDGSIFSSVDPPATLGCGASLALANLDEDGDLEILTFYGGNQIKAINYDGTVVDGWPTYGLTLQPDSGSPPWSKVHYTFADVDSDGGEDIIIPVERYTSSDFPRVYAVDRSSEIIDGFPKMLGPAPNGFNAISATPVIDDLDGDGDLELIVAGPDYNVYAFDLEAEDSESWSNTYRHDVFGQNRFEPMTHSECNGKECIEVHGAGADMCTPSHNYCENPIYCGDGILNGFEQCDGSEWNDVVDCTDVGYRGGELECFPPGHPKECTFNKMACLPCSEDDYDDELKTCTEDSFINEVEEPYEPYWSNINSPSLSSPDGDWDYVHDAEEAASVLWNSVINNYVPSSGIASINRYLLAFDTSLFPGREILEAEILLRVSYYFRQNPENREMFLVVTDHELEDGMPGVGDYSKFGNVELSSRFDFEEVDVGTDIEFLLNEEAYELIVPAGLTTFGVRGNFDLFDVFDGNIEAGSNVLRAAFYLTDSEYPPTLRVQYDVSCDLLQLKIDMAMNSQCVDVDYDYIADIDKDKDVDEVDQGLLDANFNREWCMDMLESQESPCISLDCIFSGGVCVHGMCAEGSALPEADASCVGDKCCISGQECMDVAGVCLQECGDGLAAFAEGEAQCVEENSLGWRCCVEGEEPTPSLYICDNGIVEGDEECDFGVGMERMRTCASFGLEGSAGVRCVDCVWDLSGCVGEIQEQCGYGQTKECPLQQGVCEDAMQICEASVWPGCFEQDYLEHNPYYEVVEETCDNLDNDCDGFIDGDLTRQTTCGVGECEGSTGIETCAAGSWTGDTCDPFDGAIDEQCDGLDNDCDGETDEGGVCDPDLFYMSMDDPLNDLGATYGEYAESVDILEVELQQIDDVSFEVIFTLQGDELGGLPLPQAGNYYRYAIMYYDSVSISGYAQFNPNGALSTSGASNPSIVGNKVLFTLNHPFPSSGIGIFPSTKVGSVSGNADTVVGYVPDTCSDQGGYICWTCSGTLLEAVDTQWCCDVPCGTARGDGGVLGRMQQPMESPPEDNFFVRIWKRIFGS